MAKCKEAGQDSPRPKDKDKGKGKLLPETKGTEVALTIKDAISKANDVEPKSKEADSKSKAADPKDDLP